MIRQYRMNHIVLNNAVVPHKELHHSNKNTVFAYTIHDDVYTGTVPVLYIFYGIPVRYVPVRYCNHLIVVQNFQYLTIQHIQECLLSLNGEIQMVPGSFNQSSNRISNPNPKFPNNSELIIEKPFTYVRPLLEKILSYISILLKIEE